MKNELIELLDDAMSDWDDVISECQENGEVPPDSFVEHIADYIIANGGTIQKWIPVEERLPENDYEKHWKDRKHYLVCSFWGRMTVATFGYKEYLWWIDSHDCVLSEKNIGLITHWMPLPEAPKEEV